MARFWSLVFCPETMCARAASLSCRLSAQRGSAGRFRSVPRLARTIFLAMMVGFTSAQICTNTCILAGQGSCDDGGPGAQFTGYCAYGTDCLDCGPRQSRLNMCTSGCGACTFGPVTLTYGTPNQWANEYYYKTDRYFTCSACSGVASGGRMFVYQAYDGIYTALNAYLWFDCSNGRWTRSLVGAGDLLVGQSVGESACPYQWACTGSYPTGITIEPFSWRSCPTTGAQSCLSSPPPSSPPSPPSPPSLPLPPSFPPRPPCFTETGGNYTGLPYRQSFGAEVCNDCASPTPGFMCYFGLIIGLILSCCVCALYICICRTGCLVASAYREATKDMPWPARIATNMFCCGASCEDAVLDEVLGQCWKKSRSGGQTRGSSVELSVA